MTSKSYSVWRKYTGYTVLAVVSILLLGLVFTSYTASLSALIGIVIAWPTKLFWCRLINILTNILKGIWVKIPRILLRLFFALLLFFLLLILFWWLRSVSTAPGFHPAVVEYRVTVSLAGDQKFLIQERVLLPETQDTKEFELPIEYPIREFLGGEWLELPNRELSGGQIGLLLGELKILPLEMDSRGYVDLTLKNGITKHRSLCGSYCPKVNVELIDFPKDSFYQAKYSEDIKRRTYLNTETITWSPQNPDRGISFAYILPPFHQLRVLLTPFLNIDSIGQWLLSLLALVSTVVFTPLVKPVVTDLAKEKLLSLFKPKPKKKLKIFISSKGEEKEIDVD
jgi:hypothetical protein